MWSVLMPGPAPAHLPEGTVSRFRNSSGSPYYWLGFLGSLEAQKSKSSPTWKDQKVLGKEQGAGEATSSEEHPKAE